MEWALALCQSHGAKRLKFSEWQETNWDKPNKELTTLKWQFSLFVLSPRVSRHSAKRFVPRDGHLAKGLLNS